ncbi:hypothetical protein GIB67_021292 [Kingdonia uniflora]|uniref:Syndetin C-terminal domain-containing protein n=1 Tax=Kingdonia uniflora TaxID=39325 RepID=A0A7J7LXU2_9MAGN|nr:hypothetical protein GIB67_021292 [Kingdonia uniflora]
MSTFLFQDSECQTPNKEKQNDISECSEGVLNVDSVSQFKSDCQPENISSASSTLALSDSPDPHRRASEARNDSNTASASGSSWDQLREDAIAFVSQTLRRGRKNLWQLTTSRISVLLCCSAVCSTSVHQFLKNYEDLNVFILAGETFCGVEAVEFRQRLKTVCENYFATFHRQNIYALRMVLEKESWLKMSSDTIQVISFAGLVGDGAPILVPSDGNSTKNRVFHSRKPPDPVESGNQKNGFAQWVKTGNPFMLKLTYGSKEFLNSSPTASGATDERLNNIMSPRNSDVNRTNGKSSLSEDENEDLLADFIDEDSQLPSRISKPSHSRNHSSQWNEEDITAQTGSSLCLLRLMDKYARLMQKLEIVNIEFFKGIRQLFEIFFHHIFETFGQRDLYFTGKGLNDSLNHQLKTALSRIVQECDQWIKPQLAQFSSSSPTSDVTPTSPFSSNSGNAPSISFGLKERCAGAETMSLVAQVLHKSKSHLQSMLLQNNAAAVEDFYTNLVGSVPDLIEHVHRTTARLLLHINGYVDRIANAKWELKELGLEHNGYVDLLLGEFKHYKTRLAHGGISKEVQDLLLQYGLENVAEILIEGLSRIKKCTDEGRALMSLDHQVLENEAFFFLQVLINGLQHFVSINVKPKLQTVETFIKAYYLPETEYVHWARAHPEYSRAQIAGLINLVATMKGWKKKTRLEVLDKIELNV